MENKKRVIALLSVAALLLSVCAVMTACGDKKADATEAATTAATTAATEKTADTADRNDNGSSAQSGKAEVYAGLTEEEACEKAIDAVSYGNRITICERGSYDGEDCWNIGVENTVGGIIACHVSADFCYVEDVINEEYPLNYVYAGTNAQMATLTAVEAAGEGSWKGVEYSQSSNNGEDAWYVTIQNDDGEVKNAYVIGSDCYFE